jgi:hypothetical protein
VQWAVSGSHSGKAGHESGGLTRFSIKKLCWIASLLPQAVYGSWLVKEKRNEIAGTVVAYAVCRQVW